MANCTHIFHKDETRKFACCCFFSPLGTSEFLIIWNTSIELIFFLGINKYQEFINLYFSHGKSEFHDGKWWAQDVSSSWGWSCAFSLSPLCPLLFPEHIRFSVNVFWVNIQWMSQKTTTIIQGVSRELGWVCRTSSCRNDLKFMRKSVWCLRSCPFWSSAWHLLLAIMHLFIVIS